MKVQLRVRLNCLLAFILSLMLAVPFVTPSPASAEMTISATPSLVEFEATPGGSGAQEITVFNDGDVPFSVAAGIETYKNAVDDHSMVEWLAVEPASFDLAPGEQRAVTVTMAVPENVKSGGRYAMVSFATGAPGEEQGAQVGLAGKLGVAFLMTVKGEGKVKRSAKIERFAPFLEPDGRIGFRAELNNRGNVHLRPAGAIEVKREGEDYGALEFPESTPLLPGVATDLQAQGSLPIEAGATYSAKAEIDYGAKKKLKAEVEFAVDPSIALSEVSVCENLDRGPTFATRLTNGGTVGITPHVRFVVRADSGDGGEAIPLTPSLLWPGDDLTLTADHADRLVSGAYTLVAEVAYANQEPVTVELPFSIGGDPATAAPLCAA